MDLGLSGKRAVVTGSSRGIGRAIADVLGREGCKVVRVGRTKESLEAAAQPNDELVVADVSTKEGVEALFAGRQIDVLVNNVGGSGARHWDDVDEADFAAGLDRNLWPTYRCSRAVQMPSGGAIINIASIWGKEAGGAPAYNIAKAATISLTKAMAKDVAKKNIRVCCVAPGSILFPGGGWERRQKADPDGIAEFVKRDFPFGRFGAPEEVANVVAFLASPRASWVSGACVVVDGGQSLSF